MFGTPFLQRDRVVVFLNMIIIWLYCKFILLMFIVIIDFPLLLILLLLIFTFCYCYCYWFSPFVIVIVIDFHILLLLMLLIFTCEMFFVSFPSPASLSLEPWCVRSNYCFLYWYCYCSHDAWNEVIVSYLCYIHLFAIQCAFSHHVYDIWPYMKLSQNSSPLLMDSHELQWLCANHI